MDAESAGHGVNPRLIDYFELSFTQDDVDFAIPHLQEDIPLYIDPFLLWKSEWEVYQRLHVQLLAFFEHLREQVLAGRRVQAMQTLMECRETREIGLGYSMGSKSGSSIGPQLANRILDVYEEIPQIQETGLDHIEVLGLVVPKLAEDRISDLTAAILKGFFIAFSEDRARARGIPTKRFQLDSVYDFERRLWKPQICDLPFNPLDDTPLLLPPLNLLRHLPWINYADYYRSRFAHLVLPAGYGGKNSPRNRFLHLTERAMSQSSDTLLTAKKRRRLADPLHSLSHSNLKPY